MEPLRLRATGKSSRLALGAPPSLPAWSPRGGKGLGDAPEWGPTLLIYFSFLGDLLSPTAWAGNLGIYCQDWLICSLGPSEVPVVGSLARTLHIFFFPFSVFLISAVSILIKPLPFFLWKYREWGVVPFLGTGSDQSRWLSPGLFASFPSAASQASVLKAPGESNASGRALCGGFGARDLSPNTSRVESLFTSPQILPNPPVPSKTTPSLGAGVQVLWVRRQRVGFWNGCLQHPLQTRATSNSDTVPERRVWFLKVLNDREVSFLKNVLFSLRLLLKKKRREEKQ